MKSVADVISKDPLYALLVSIWVTAFASALTKVCAPTYVEVPTSTTNVFVVTDKTLRRSLSPAGSVERGYGWFVACPSLAHVNVIDSSSRVINSPFKIPWPLTVMVKSPVAESYAALVGVSDICSSAPVILTVSPVVNPWGYSVVTVAFVPLPVRERTCLDGLKLIAIEHWMPLPDWYLKYFLVCLTICESGELPAVMSTPPSKGLWRNVPSALTLTLVST